MIVLNLNAIVSYIVQFLPELFALLLLILDHIERSLLPDSIRMILREGVMDNSKNAKDHEDYYKDVQRAINVENLKRRHFVPGLIAMISSISYGMIADKPKIILGVVAFLTFIFAIDIKIVSSNLTMENYTVIKKSHFWVTILLLVGYTAAKFFSLNGYKPL